MSRQALTAERALAEAMALADTEGLSGLTMRKLASRLGVEAMSLYHHLPNKDALLDGMVDQVYTEVELPLPDEPWQPAMQRRAESLRAALLRHPWAVELLDSRSTPGPATLAHHEAIIRNLRDSGFSWHLTAHAFSLIDAYVFGFVIQEIQLPFDTPEENQELAEDIMEGMSQAFPYLTQFTMEHVMQPGYNYGNEFDYGLNLVLRGLTADYSAPDS